MDGRADPLMDRKMAERRPIYLSIYLLAQLID